MKKLVILIVFLFTAVSVFAQNYTFQGLPWGSTKEQVIAKLGEPISITDHGASYGGYANIALTYHVTLNGYNALLRIQFHNSKMDSAHYWINRQPFRNLDEVQASIAFFALFKQLTDKYGAFHEVITYKGDGKEEYWAWHFNNFHIFICPILLNEFLISYGSNYYWKIQEEDLKNKNRLPNRNL